MARSMTNDPLVTSGVRRAQQSTGMRSGLPVADAGTRGRSDTGTQRHGDAESQGQRRPQVACLRRACMRPRCRVPTGSWHAPQERLGGNGGSQRACPPGGAQDCDGSSRCRACATGPDRARPWPVSPAPRRRVPMPERGRRGQAARRWPSSPSPCGRGVGHGPHRAHGVLVPFSLWERGQGRGLLSPCGLAAADDLLSSRPSSPSPCGRGLGERAPSRRGPDRRGEGCPPARSAAPADPEGLRAPLAAAKAARGRVRE
jgi:hypothetical protein